MALGMGRERSQKGSKVSDWLEHLRHNKVLLSWPMNRSGRGEGRGGEGRGGEGREGEGREYNE